MSEVVSPWIVWFNDDQFFINTYSFVFVVFSVYGSNESRSRWVPSYPKVLFSSVSHT